MSVTTIKLNPADSPSPSIWALTSTKIIALLLLLSGVALYFLLPTDSPLAIYPKSWRVDLAGPLGDFIKYMAREFSIGPIEFKSITRWLGWLISQPFLFLNGILADGFTLYHADNSRTVIQPLPWFATSAMFVFVAWRIAGKGLALFAAAIFFYFALFGLWESAMLTFSSVVIAVIVSTILGVLLGLWGYRSPLVDLALQPLYDIMQTLPLFSYLVPMILFFGFGPIAALMATVVFALPPMARVTTQALRETHNSIIELSKIAGCTRTQTNLLVLIPSARKKLLLGINQVIMLSLAVVIVASLIGAGGLGGDVLKALKSVRIGEALAAGLAITFMAIFMDRLSYAIALRRPEHYITVPRWYQKYATLLVSLGIIVVLTLISLAVPFLYTWPDEWAINIGRHASTFLSWVSENYYDEIAAFRDWCILNIMKPMKLWYLSVPWLTVTLMAGGVGYFLGGWRLALLSITIFGLIAMMGYWKKAMISAYMVHLSVIFAALVGFLLGLWGAVSDRAEKVLIALVDLLQTLPTFVFLIPVVMLFSVGEFPALVAIFSYAVAPAIRYTIVGIRSVPQNLINASIISGCTPFQLMTQVKIPLSLPTILLGLNQTLMMAFGMLVITALVGSRGLEEITLTSIAKVQPGEGLMAGLAIAGMAIVYDRYIRAASRKLAYQLGIPAPK